MGALNTARRIETSVTIGTLTFVNDGDVHETQNVLVTIFAWSPSGHTTQIGKIVIHKRDWQGLVEGKARRDYALFCVGWARLGHYLRIRAAAWRPSDKEAE